jgi:myo-inositol 2-dehydrogenase / D-chiro-inositol 1-dehydrogenase
MSNRPVSRRHFLGNAAVAGAAGILWAAGSSSAGADEGSSNKNVTLRWGIIGTGTRGTFTHVPVLKEAPESRIVALCDVAEDRLQNAATKVGASVATYKDYQKLLADADVNAVVIATPNLLHREMLAAALAAGKHVLCEKPAGASPADAAEMKRAADGAKTVVMFGMQYRNNARQQKIHELIESGRIGKPKYLVQNCSRGDWNLSPNVWQYADPKLSGGKPRNWRFSHAASGGTLNEFSCHYLDLLHWMAGGLPPRRISCDGGIAVYKDGRDTWDHATVTMTYADDVTAVHTLCMFGPGRADLTVIGEEGSIEMISGDALRLVNFGRRGATRGGGGNKTQEVHAPEPEGHSADRATLGLYQDFLACVKGGKRPEASAERAVAASRTCWLAELAAERKAEVKWEELDNAASA